MSGPNMLLTTAHAPKKVDDIFITMQRYGLSHSDIVKLENLSDKTILDNLNGGFRHLVKEDIEYMRSFADLWKILDRRLTILFCLV